MRRRKCAELILPIRLRLPIIGGEQLTPSRPCPALLAQRQAQGASRNPDQREIEKRPVNALPSMVAVWLRVTGIGSTSHPRRQARRGERAREPARAKGPVARGSIRAIFFRKVL